MHPSITVVTVVRNAKSLIAKTLQSVQTQQYESLEHLVIDGQSTDGTLDEIQRLAHDKLQVWSEADSGIYDAMNKGAQRAQGQFIIFLNAGDHFTSAHSLAAVARAIADSEEEIFFGKCLWVDPERALVLCKDQTHFRFKSQLFHENFPHPATIYRRTAFHRFGYFDTRLSVYADYEWNLRALVGNNAAFKVLDTAVAVFYTGGISTNPVTIGARESEKSLIRAMYFQHPPWNQNDSTYPFIGKIIRHFLGQRLNRTN